MICVTVLVIFLTCVSALNEAYGLAPLDIDFKLIKDGDTTVLPEGVVPYNGTALRCNETTPSGGEVCSCQDCQESCPVVPPPQPPAGRFQVSR